MLSKFYRMNIKITMWVIQPYIKSENPKTCTGQQAIADRCRFLLFFPELFDACFGGIFDAHGRVEGIVQV